MNLLRYKYQFSSTPSLPPGIGIRQTEVRATSQEDADAKIGLHTQEWMEGWATDEGTTFVWAYSRDDRVIRSGVAHPRQAD